jgi:outer membrane lipoprotein SlyB
MTTQTNDSSRVLMWVAGVAVILFSVLGIAAIMGWIPTSMGSGNENGVMTAPEKHSGIATKPAAGKTTVHAPAVVASNSSSPAHCSECGVIESTREVASKGEGSGLGAVGGAVVGGLIGTQVGSGRGKTVATAIGAVGGAVAGNEVEKRVKTTKSYEIDVRMDDGSSRVFNQASLPSWRAGDRVRIVNGVLQSNS